MRQVMYCGVILLLCGIMNEEGVDGSDAERRLIRDLFTKREYDPTVRPVKYDGQAVNVTYNLALFQLISINEKAQTISISAWIRQKWKDSQLSWNKTEYANIADINVPPSKVWLPDIVHYNNVNDDFEYGGNIDTLKTRVNIYYTGDMFWLAPVILRGNCIIKVRDFPFDTQHCTLKFGSWTYDMSKLDINTTSNTMDVAKYMENNEWHLKKTAAVRNEIKYTCCPNPYPDVTFHIYLARRSLFYVLNLVFPIAVITLLTTLSFVLPAESGERISLAVTLMLAVTVFMLLVAETTPATSDAVPLVSIYFILCMVAMFVMIVLLCYINRMYHKKGTDGKMGSWTRRVILNKLSYIVGIQPGGLLNSYNCSERTKQKNIKGITNNGMDASLQNGVVLNNKKPINPELNVKEGKKLNIDPKDLTRLKDISKTSEMNTDDTKNLDAIIQRLNSKDEDHTFKGEWRIVAMTIDRCLFFFFVTIFIITTIACFAHTSYIT